MHFKWNIPHTVYDWYCLESTPEFWPEKESYWFIWSHCVLTFLCELIIKIKINPCCYINTRRALCFFFLIFCKWFFFKLSKNIRYLFEKTLLFLWQICNKILRTGKVWGVIVLVRISFRLITVSLGD